MNSDLLLKTKEMACKMRRKALDMALKAGPLGSHLGPALSSIEIFACLYGSVMTINAKNPEMENRDRFVPSKAHCVLAFYTALAYSGYFPVEELDNFEINGSDLPGHPVMNIKKGIEFSGGSLGMGLSQGIGMAIEMKRKNINNNIFVLLGDGECDEGSVWEAAMSAAHFHLDNLIAIIDCNKLQYDGPTEEVMALNSLSKKFESFGFNVFEVDGHDIEKLYDVFKRATALQNGRPVVVIADTVKGKGISFMENKKEWHHSRLTKEQHEQAVTEIKTEVK